KLDDCISGWAGSCRSWENVGSAYIVVCDQSVRVHRLVVNHIVQVSLIASSAARTESILVAYEVERRVLRDGYWVERVVDYLYPVHKWGGVRDGPTRYRYGL